jgi:hypothetical protein
LPPDDDLVSVQIWPAEFQQDSDFVAHSRFSNLATARRIGLSDPNPG